MPPSIHPVFLGIHSIGDDYSKEEIDYLRNWEPIGCRDAYTYHILKNKRIKVYLHGCLTSTLPYRNITPKEGKVYIVDVCESFEPYIPEHLRKNAVRRSHQIYGKVSDEQNWEEYTKNILSDYEKNAALVITSRLHCASPCLAMGIPVVFACEKVSPRYIWINNLIKIYEKDEWKDIDWMPKPVKYEALKQKIIHGDIKRIQDTVNGIKNESYEDYFQVGSVSNVKFGDLMRIKQFVQDKWRNDEHIEYAIWGVTELAECTYKYLKQNFPNAKLVAVYDNYRNLEFHNIKTKPIESFNEKDGIYLFATGNSTSIAAKLLFEQNGWNTRLLCTFFEVLYQKIEDSRFGEV